MRWVLGLSWIGGTAVALLVVSGVVSVVAAQMGDSASGVLTRDAVERTLAGAASRSALPSGSAPAVTSTASPTSSPTSSPAISPTSSPLLSSEMPAPTPSANASVASLPPAPSASPVPTVAASASASYDLVGGSARVSCAGPTARAEWASPKPSFTVTVEGSGTTFLEIRFRSVAHESKLEVTCPNGAPAAQVRERAS